MSLSQQLAEFVSAGSRSRGGPYQRSVRIKSGDAWTVVAEVQGTSLYNVELWREGNTVNVWCNCPYFERNGSTCKHIWATLLAAESRGLLLGDGKTGTLRLEEYIDDEGEDDEGFDEDYNEHFEDEERDAWVNPPSAPRPVGSYSMPSAQKSRSRRATHWKQVLHTLQSKASPPPLQSGIAAPPGNEILYVLDVEATLKGQGLLLEFNSRHRKKDGDWSKPKSHRVSPSEIDRLPDAADRQILTLLGGASTEYEYVYSYQYSQSVLRYRLKGAIQDEVAPLIARTGRCCYRRSVNDPELHFVQWDDGGPWQFRLNVAREPNGTVYRVTGQLRRGDEIKDLREPVLLVAGGLVLWNDRLAPLDDGGAFPWIASLRDLGAIKVPEGQKDDFLNALYQLPQLPRLDLPSELAYEEIKVVPKPRLKVRKPDRHWGAPRLQGDLAFDYDGEIVPASRPGRGVYQASSRRLILRDPAAEADAATQLQQLGFRPERYYGSDAQLALTPRHLPRVVSTLTAAGWHVEAEGKLYRNPGAFHLDVKSGIDWFDLNGRVDFGETSAALPELLAALHRGEDTVRLDDGTFGILPQEWLRKYAPLAGMGHAEDGHLRFTASQVGLLDALLASQPEVSFDTAFVKARDELRQFDGIEPADPPEGFVGELRGYQREGLGWLRFLQRFRFGGCLADDMGLGKTVMVLALLESRRMLRGAKRTKKDLPGPSLVVVPRSLIHNWIHEAARFAPNLRVLDHTGIARTPPGAHFDQYDAIITTYGTLRRDVLALKDLKFDYCVLDEAQTVKNANTESAKAVRLISCSHRLALSGTPVENHLGELWSLIDFLNPGMLGSASAFRIEGGLRNPDEATRAMLARAVRPFILRRTKEQVASDLPAKTEQTIFCELDSAQRKRYDALRRHYQEALLGQVDRQGIRKAALQILEALLRLRQAACHPGLIDKKQIDEPSAKLDTLRAQLNEVLAGGHKALVFSQFTSLLAILRKQLDRDGVPYVYLDGRTRDRAARVEQFQNDPESKLFLISLKAGGLGLNLTAAEYVFLLDPWWNPAVEAQAIDRAHRIGQTRPVFAYRLIAKDTVEEKVLELQQSKRALADAIINVDNSLIRNLERKDLELLLG